MILLNWVSVDTTQTEYSRNPNSYCDFNKEYGKVSPNPIQCEMSKSFNFEKIYQACVFPRSETHNQIMSNLWIEGLRLNYFEFHNSEDENSMTNPWHLATVRIQ